MQQEQMRLSKRLRLSNLREQIGKQLKGNAIRLQRFFVNVSAFPFIVQLSQSNCRGACAAIYCGWLIASLVETHPASLWTLYDDEEQQQQQAARCL